MRVLAFVFVPLAAAIQLHAAPREITMDVLTKSAPPRVEVLHVFGGHPINLELTINAPLHSNIALKADQLQLSKALVAPIAKGIVISEKLDFSEHTRLRIPAALQIPEVKNKTEMLVRFYTQDGDNQSTEPVGQLHITAYPKDVLKELKVLFSDGEEQSTQRIGIYGTGTKLREFFQAENIPFEDCGEERPEILNPKLVYVGEVNSLSAPLPQAGDQKKLLVFCLNEDRLPGVYLTRAADEGSFVGIVTLPILDELSTNPKNQIELTRIFLQVLGHEQRATSTSQ